MTTNHNCLDCGKDTIQIGEYYMVRDRIWKKAGMTPRGGMLCVGCLEARLGRQITYLDILWCPLNVSNCFGGSSQRLQDRLGAQYIHL